MKSYLISYDLVTPGRDYKLLYDAIRTYSLWAHPLESVWIVKTTTPAKEIRNHLERVIDKNDRLFIAHLSGESAWLNLDLEVSSWLQNNL